MNQTFSIFLGRLQPHLGIEDPHTGDYVAERLPAEVDQLADVPVLAGPPGESEDAHEELLGLEVDVELDAVVRLLAEEHVEGRPLGQPDSIENKLSSK